MHCSLKTWNRLNKGVNVWSTKMERYAKYYSLIQNRVKISNQILGARYINNMDNPVRISAKGTSYHVTIYGCMVCSWHIYKLEEIENAFESVDRLADDLWMQRLLLSAKNTGLHLY